MRCLRNLVPALIFLSALAACGASEAPAADEPVVAEDESALFAEDDADLYSRECGDVLAYYAAAIDARRYEDAARVWGSSRGVAADQLEELHEGWGNPELEIGDLRLEGAAGTSYCEARVTLLFEEAALGPDVISAPRRGTITLMRANDVPGATPEQLRWTIRESTLLEPMERVGASSPA